MLQKRCVLVPLSGHDGDILRVKAFAQQPGDHCARGGGIRTGLDNCGVAGGDGVSQRIEREKKRIVPRAHNEHVSVGRGLAVAFRGELRKRRVNRARAGKAARMAEHVADLA